MNRPRSARQFLRSAASSPFTFNVAYADDRDIAMFSAGRLPLRAPGVDPSLPTDGRGAHEWRGFLPARRHPQVINPKSGVLVNWNNKPARNFPPPTTSGATDRSTGRTCSRPASPSGSGTRSRPWCPR